MLEEERGLSPH